MTTPSQPIVIRGQGAEGGLTPLIAAIQRNRQFAQISEQLRLDREKFELEQAKAKKSAEMTDEQIARLKLESKKIQDDLKQREDERTGRELGIAAVNDIGMFAESNGLSFTDPEFRAHVNSVRATLNDQYAQAEVDEYMESLGKQEATASTIDAQTANALATAAQEARLREQNVQERQTDWVTAMAQSDGALTAQQAADQVGAVLPASIPPDLRFPSAAERAAAGARGAKATEMQVKAQTFATEMAASLPIIQSLIEKTGGVNFISDYIKRGGKLATITGNALLSEDQQRLMQAGLRYAAAWQYFSSGQQINEQEFDRLMSSTFFRFGDKEGTIQQKSALQRVQLEAIRAVASGGAGGPAESSVRALEVLLSEARANQWDPEMITAISDQLLEAKAWQRTLLANPDAFVLGSPQVPGTDVSWEGIYDNATSRYSHQR